MTGALLATIRGLGWIPACIKRSSCSQCRRVECCWARCRLLFRRSRLESSLL